MGKEDAPLTWLETMLSFIETHFISLIFTAIFFSVIIYLVKLNFANSEYKDFHLAHMVTTKEGFLDRRAVERFGLYLMSMYGFLHVLHKVTDQISTYFSLMAGIWLTAHVAGNIANKFPNRDVPPKDTDAGHS